MTPVGRPAPLLGRALRAATAIVFQGVPPVPAAMPLGPRAPPPGALIGSGFATLAVTVGTRAFRTAGA
ncbi:hypothetical protein ABZ642_05450 [Streptomyces sp. NPDC007157]|uniref:hypothetical protein n=1 Tax=Streptomyces sp. NPDC007157 TaxID=3154681 RepID=UPI0033F57712